jgi:hypothetical protein
MRVISRAVVERDTGLVAVEVFLEKILALSRSKPSSAM